MMRVYVAALIMLIIAAHIDMPRDLVLKHTIINGTAWAIILIPAWAVGKWAAVHASQSCKSATAKCEPCHPARQGPTAVHSSQMLRDHPNQ